MTITTKTTFITAASQEIDAITSRNLGKPAWVTGVELMALADGLNIAEVSLDVLQNEIKLRRSHFFLDGHNWSDSLKANNENFIQFCQLVYAKKARVGA